MKGDILCNLGRMQEVIVVTRQALHINPTYIPSLTQAIQALRSLELYQALKEHTRDLIEQTPDSLFAREHYMRACRGLGQYEEAYEAFERLIELDPTNIRFWTWKADTLYRLERYREAANTAERAVRIDADYPPARRIREKAVRMMYQKKEKKTPRPKQPQ
jgi:tetratricopeptide (TPR) repeat protein